MIGSFLNLYAMVTLGGGQMPLTNTVPTEPPTINYEESLSASTIPLKKISAVEPIIEAQAALIVDYDSGAILYEKNGNTPLQIASITKLMTVIIATEEGNLDDVVTVSKNASLTEGSKVWLYQGEQITLRNLIYASLIHSGNDAAVAISEHIAGDVPSFVEKMNQKTKKIGLYSTHFQNPIGFDDPENYSTVKDLSLLARYVFRKEIIRNAVKNKTFTISSIDGNLTHDLESTNELLGSFLNVLGLKTGHTPGAGLCFVSVIENDDGNRIVTVILNSPDRFKETKLLASWAFNSYIW